MDDQALPDDVLMEIFTRTDPKTAARCRTASTTWHIRLSSDEFRRDNTLANSGKHHKVLLQIGDPETMCSSWSICLVDCLDGRITAAPIPEQLGPRGWWSVISSDCGMICVRYSRSGFDLRLMVWNPLLRVARQLEDPADTLWKQAFIGYAFGYWTRADNYYVVHVSKRHLRDRFLHCNIFNSANGCWKHGYINDQHLTHLGASSAFHLSKALWINWGGREDALIAAHVVVLDADNFLLSKIRINRRSIQHVQAMCVLDGIPHLFRYERSPLGLSAIWCKIELDSMCIVPFIKLGVACQFGVPWLPVMIMGDCMITVHENKDRRARGANGVLVTEISLDQINLVSRHRVTAFKGEWPSDMSLQRALLVGWFL